MSSFKIGCPLTCCPFQRTWPLYDCYQRWPRHTAASDLAKEMAQLKIWTCTLYQKLSESLHKTQPSCHGWRSRCDGKCIISVWTKAGHILVLLNLLQPCEARFLCEEIRLFLGHCSKSNPMVFHAAGMGTYLLDNGYLLWSKTKIQQRPLWWQ